MFNGYLLKIFYKDAVIALCAASFAVSSPSTARLAEPLKLTVSATSITPTRCKYERENYTASVYMQTKLWRYLRRGINYLEASGKEVNPYFMHPGRKAYGPLALTPVAIKDVRGHCPNLAGYSTEEVLLDKELYEAFAFAYADLLLKHYLKVDYFKMDRKEVFKMLEKAWFLGPTLYKKGHPVISSLEAKAKEYLTASVI